MAFKRPWLEFSPGRSDEKAVSWWLFEVVLRGRGRRDSQIETMLPPVADPAVRRSWHLKREVEKCLNVTIADTIFVFFFFMPPLFARSSSNELGQLSQHAAPLTALWGKHWRFGRWRGKYFLWHDGSLTPVFPSTSLRMLSTCLVVEDWEGLPGWLSEVGGEERQVQGDAFKEVVFEMETKTFRWFY